MNPDLYQELVRQINSLQKQVDGLIKPELGRWITWTPTITQSVGVAVTVNYASYNITNRIGVISCKVTCTGAGVANNDIIIGGVPAIVQPTFAGSRAIGSGQVLDTGVAYYSGVLVAVGGSDFRIYVHNNPPAAGSAIGSNPNFALAAGDEISMTAVYQVN